MTSRLKRKDVNTLLLGIEASKPMDNMYSNSLIKYIFLLNTERDKLLQHGLKETQAKSRKLSNQLRKSLWQSQSQAKHHEEKTIFRCYHKQAVYL